MEKKKITPKKASWGSLSCTAVLKLMNSEKERPLDPFERNAVFAHCTVCSSCRATQRHIIDDLLARGSDSYPY